MDLKRILLLICLIISFYWINAQKAKFEWAKSIGGDYYDGVRAITVDADGNVYATRCFTTIDFDPGAGIFNLTASASDDIYVLKLNS